MIEPTDAHPGGVPISDRMSRLLVRHLVSSVHEGIIVYDQELRYRIWNPFMVWMSGKPASDVLGKLPLEVFPWLASVGLMDHLRTALDGGMPPPLEFPFEVNGRPGWCIDTSMPLRDEQDAIVGVVAVVEDVSQIRAARKEVEQSSRRFRAMIERSSDVVAAIDASGRLTYASPNAARITGYNHDERIGRSGFETVHPEDLPRVREVLARLVASPVGSTTSLEFRAIRPGGEVWWVEGNAVNLLEDPDVGAVVINYRDVSLRRAREVALAESERLLGETQRIAHVGTWGAALPTMEAFWSAETYRIFGLQEGACQPSVDAFLGLIHPDDRRAMQTWLADCLAGHRPPELQFRIVRPDGSVATLNGRGDIEIDAHGMPTRMFGSVQDITDRVLLDDRRKADAQLIEDSQRAARAGWYSLDIRTGVWQSSTLLNELFGIDQAFDRSVGGWLTLVHPDDREMMIDHFQRHVLQEHKPFDKQYRIVRVNDGTTRWVHGRGALSLDAAGQPLVMAGLIQDITDLKTAEAERRRLEEQLQHAQKMEAIGTLAGGVAHDFNNILGGILGGLSLLEMDLADRGQASSELENMKALVRRGAELARQLLGFARKGRYDVKPLDLLSVARNTASMFGRSRHDIVIEYDFASDVKAVLMDHTQLEQVLLNLLLNAGQAMPGGGRVLIRASNVRLGPSEARASDVEPGQYVELSVADTGVGMDAATMARIFEPFFTTKSAGHGSGLGLASTYGILRHHGGAISVNSAPHAGATFTLLIPSTEQKPAVVQAAGPVSHEGRGTILVVDDEQPIREVCGQMLRRMGYEVLTAEGGRRALELVGQHKERLSLVILDLTMPEMSGAVTFDEIRKIAPALKVLLASGYSPEGQASELMARGCNGFIQKPFDPQALVAKLRDLALDAGAAAGDTGARPGT